MALIIPSASSVYSVSQGVRTYADATRTEGGHLAKYVLAQFRSDSKLEWVAELRRLLTTEELKWLRFKDGRPKLKESAQLWSRIEAGVGQATVVIMDPDPVDRSVKELLRKQEAEPGYHEAVTRETAIAFVSGTPIAHLPYDLDRAIPWSRYEPVTSLERFTPERILLQLAGASQKSVVSKSMVFAARAHAIFDVAVKDASAASTRDLFRSPLSKVLLAELLATQRFFDSEQPATVELLNSAAEEIASNLRATMPLIGDISDEPLVQEVDSRAIDELQAADIAAGWARELLDLDPSVRRLAQVFERVLLNGAIIK
jgi:hypothetical protein